MAGKKKSTGGKSRPLSSTFSANSRKLTCPTCGYVTFLKARYTKHVKYHSMPFIKCEFCEFESQYSWNLERHMKNHTNSDGKRMQCPLCNFACDMKQSLTSHVQNHHKDVPEEIMSQFRTSCASSPRKSPNPGSRRQSSEHFIQDNELDNSYENEEDETFGDQVMQIQVFANQRQQHAPQHQQARKKAKTMNEVKGDDRSLFMKKFYKCKFCNFNALSELGLSRHMSHSHKNKNNVKSAMGVAVLGFGGKSANSKIHSQMPILHKKSSGNESATARVRLGNHKGIRIPMAKPMPSLIPIPKPSSSISSSPSIIPGISNSSLFNNTSHQSHEKESKPVPSSYQHQIQSRHQNKLENEEDDMSEKVKFLLSLGLTQKTTVSHPPNEIPFSSYYNSHNNINHNNIYSRKVGTQRRTSFFEKLSKKLTSNQIVKEEDTTFPSLSQASRTNNSIMMKTAMNTKNSIISITSNSTRCQYCRHRNKTSQDLLNHLEQCQEAQRFLASEDEPEGSQGMGFNDEDEQKIFVWNNGGDVSDDNEDLEEQAEEDENINQEYFHNFEGFSGITMDLENYKRQLSSPTTVSGGGISDVVSPKSGENSVTKSRKVYKCPQSDCEFWATTASRFHVHIVAHYNTKPFECSQCSYRSNWRWDITKHIKLKTMRDPGHIKAKVLLTHRSGERNYRKYDRYLVPMSVTYSADAKLPDCSTVASKRSDVELDSSPSPSSVPQKQKSNSNLNAKPVISSRSSSPSTFIPMPKLTKAPSHSLADGSYKNLRQALNSQLVKDSFSVPPTLPVLKPIITISPYVPLSNPKSSVTSAGRTFVEKRMLAGGEMLQNLESLGREITVTPISSSSANNELQVPGRNKSAVTWKCKKCSFKNSNKNKVIIHINQNHKPKSGESMSILSQNNLVEQSLSVSGTGFLSATNRIHPASESNYNREESYEDMYNCSNCAFSSTSESGMNEHEENCVGAEDELYTCMYCSQEFTSQKEGLQHILLHERVVDSMDVDEDVEDGWDTVIGEAIQNESILPEEIRAKPPRGSAAQQSGLIFKKYHCKECPYVTDSKGQFIYHKKFHVASPNSPYKCGSCSYRVSHKHLLQQHVRVHGNQEGRLENMSPPSRQLEQGGFDDEELEQDEVIQSRPRLMLWKDGQPHSVVRCCFCPQVFVNGRDLTEHEDQHKRNEKEVASSKGRSPHQSYDDEDEVVYNGTDDGVLNLSTKSGSNAISTLNSQLPRKQYDQNQSLLYLCQQCPARFFYDKELRIHSTFHERKNEFKCQLCSYSARQATPHLMSHMNVHSTEYQDKTRSLLQTKYRVAPKLDSLTSPALESQRMPILKRMTPVSISPSTTGSKMSIPDASIPCRRCPARFSSLASFITHSQRHGMKTGFKCRHCDFAAQTQNNLTLHSILHAGSEVTIEPEVSDGDFALADLMSGNNKQLRAAFISTPERQQIPTVVPGADVEAQDARGREDYMDFSVEGAGAFQGNPEFKYQTYVKNGKIKSKRYKCCKCPSAFEKRDQYKVHMGLHGSDQRYKCTVCDYSVTYYANFIQHLKKHENQANVTKEQLIATPLSRMNKVVTSPQTRVQSKVQGVDATEEKNKAKIVPPLVLKVPKAGAASAGKSNIKKHLFKSDNGSDLAEHEEGHEMTSHQEKCPFCRFSSKDKESLKAHLRVHFDTDFTPVMEIAQQPQNENGTTSPTDSSDSEVENDDYEAVVKKANKKKIIVNFPKPEISVDHC